MSVVLPPLLTIKLQPLLEVDLLLRFFSSVLDENFLGIFKLFQLIHYKRLSVLTSVDFYLSFICLKSIPSYGDSIIY